MVLCVQFWFLTLTTRSSVFIKGHSLRHSSGETTSDSIPRILCGVHVAKPDPPSANGCKGHMYSTCGPYVLVVALF